MVASISSGLRRRRAGMTALLATGFPQGAISMAITGKHSAAQSASITYITLGGLMAVPSAVWYMMFSPEGIGKFFCATFFLLGLGGLIMGLSMGYIGRAARQAEMPPTTAAGTVIPQGPA